MSATHSTCVECEKVNVVVEFWVDHDISCAWLGGCNNAEGLEKEHPDFLLGDFSGQSLKTKIKGNRLVCSWLVSLPMSE